MNNRNHSIFQKNGFLPDKELNDLNALAERWQNPSLKAAYFKMRCFRYAIQADIDSVKHYVNQIKALGKITGNAHVNLSPDRLLAIAYGQAKDYTKQVVLLENIIALNRKYQHNVLLTQN